MVVKFDDYTKLGEKINSEVEVKRLHSDVIH